MSLSLGTKIVAPFLEMLNTFSLVKRWCFSLKIRAFVRCSHGNEYVNHSAVFEIFFFKKSMSLNPSVYRTPQSGKFKEIKWQALDDSSLKLNNPLCGSCRKGTLKTGCWAWLLLVGWCKRLLSAERVLHQRSANKESWLWWKGQEFEEEPSLGVAVSRKVLGSSSRDFPPKEMDPL